MILFYAGCLVGSVATVLTLILFAANEIRKA